MYETDKEFTSNNTVVHNGAITTELLSPSYGTFSKSTKKTTTTIREYDSNGNVTKETETVIEEFPQDTYTPYPYQPYRVWNGPDATPVAHFN